MSSPGADQSHKTARIVLAVTGSIAAFKAASLASALVQDGNDVRVILTDGGARFVTPLTFGAITGNPVASDIWEEQPESSRMGHIELSRWAEILVVAPASASSIARLALGLSSDLLGAVALAGTAPLLVAPAMETHMWTHQAIQGYVKTLKARGVSVVGPESGHLASGSSGTGRMVEPAEIRESVVALLCRSQSLKGKRVLVTAGPTYEPIDPVRFIGNRSSGKMGYAIAEAARDRGAEVTLVSGPTALAPPHAVRVIPVETAAQMRDSAVSVASIADVIVMAAAVADFRPSGAASEKIKRANGLALDLSPTEDIAAELVQVAPHAFHVGFALETGDLVSAARRKLRRKGQQLVVANEVSDRHNPFGADTNCVVLVTEEDATELPQMSKRDVAAAALDRVEEALNKKSPRIVGETE